MFNNYLDNYSPPLRLILTTRCNGKCFFCHKEGATGQGDMPLSTVMACVAAATELYLPVIALTGGEPTLRDDLSSIINEISTTATNSKINLTTNGYLLAKIIDKIDIPISTLNLSMTSLDADLNLKFQGVEPFTAFNVLKNFPALNRKVNVVVTNLNINSIIFLVEFCISHSVSVDILFELREFSDNDFCLQRSLIEKLQQFGNMKIELKSVPVLSIDIDSGCKISLKHPSLSALAIRNICINCVHRNKCFERVCAVRVYPNSNITPCLNGFIVSKSNGIFEKIKDIYSQIMDDFFICDFMFGGQTSLF